MKAAIKTISCFIFIAAMPCMHTVAQSRSEFRPDQYRAMHWTGEDSLPSGQALTMYKDTYGFLWIGSAAASGTSLCRFDGIRFKMYYVDLEERGAINSGSIRSFKEDSLHNIWIGTSRGLSRYDNTADTFTNFSPHNPGTSERTIAPFWATKDEVFCLEPGRIISAFNIHTLSRRILIQLSKNDTLFADQSSSGKSFLEKNTNSIWALHWDTEGYGMLQQIFLDGRKPQYYKWPCYHNPRRKHTHGEQPRHNAEDVQYDAKRNSVWINSGEGLIEFSLSDRQFRRIEAFDYSRIKDIDRGVGIDVDENGRVWVGTHTKGIFVYDPATDHVQPVFTDPFQQQEVGAENLHVYCDRAGIVWVSNWNGKGLYELLPFSPITERMFANPLKKDSLSSGMITTIHNGPQGKLWIGTADGLNIFDPSTEKFEVWRAKDLPGIKGKAIIPLYIDTIHQKAWLNAGSQETFQEYFGMQMYEMDIGTRQCRPIELKAGSKKIDKFLVSHTLVRPFNDGIIFCDEMNGVFELKRGSLVAELLIPVKLRSGFGGIALVEDRYLFLQGGGSIPNATFENIDGKWTKISHTLDTLSWSCMSYQTTDKTYWVGFRGELVHYDNNFTKITSYNKRNGYSSVALNMQIDNEGNLWFVTESKKICRLSPATGNITTLSEKDGYHAQDYYWFAPITIDGQGRMYLGVGWKTGIESRDWGLDRIYPERYGITNQAIVYITSLHINQKQVPVSAAFNVVNELTLNYKQNNIRIGAGIIDFYAKTSGRIRYKLEQGGKIAEWQFPSDNTIRYEDLRPGTYKLTIQASNASGEFIGEKSLLIYIAPPFWQTWWFILLVVVVVIAFIYGFMRYRSRSLKQKNALLEKKVNERTTELVQRTNELHKSLSDLKTTQDQLIHSEKMASLGELTSGIAHEIKNPLNFINNFSEINIELITEINDQPGREDENAQIIKTLKKNLEKINHHGKRVDDIVKSMLQHSRIGNLTKEPVNVNALCEESLKLAYHGFKAKEKTFQASFETHFDPHLPQMMVIPQELSRVLLNLFNNAFYAVHEKKKKMQLVSTDASEIESSYKPMVIVSTKKADKNIVITVSDNGTGIPQKIVNKIFQPFFTTKPTGEGTGLGLSMSYDIITKSHGGELYIKSKDGEGTDFVITLPV